MGLFQFFRKQKAKPEYNLPYPFEVLQNGLTPQQYMDKWQKAQAQPGIPVLLLMDNNLQQSLVEGSCCLDTVPDIDSYLAARVDDEFSYMLDEMKGSPGDKSDAIHILSSFGMNDGAVLLAHIPVEEPWRIFEQLPIGGWNECPEPEYIAAYCKKLYENYGAQPALISGDTLELVVQRQPGKEEALELAKEMYLFCNDLVDQGTESIYALADSLHKSSVWFFWWD